MAHNCPLIQSVHPLTPSRFTYDLKTELKNIENTLHYINTNMSSLLIDLTYNLLINCSGKYLFLHITCFAMDNYKLNRMTKKLQKSYSKKNTIEFLLTTYVCVIYMYEYDIYDCNPIKI